MYIILMNKDRKNLENLENYLYFKHIWIHNTNSPL